MGSLLSAIQSTGHSLDVFEQAMGIIQSNVANASTPGYVTQTLNLSASAFQPGSNLYGGVQVEGVQSSRNQSAEQAVWAQNGALGTATQQSASLNSLQSLFSVSGTSGIPAALSSLYSAFSAWSTTPSSSTAQQQVLSAASQVTQAFNSTAAGVNQLASQNASQLQSTVSQINQLSSQIAQLNGQMQSTGGTDGGLTANLYNDLEKLSNLTSITVQTGNDGTVSVLMGGQTPLVNGATALPLSVSFTPAGGTNPNAPPDAQILSSSGQDVTNVVSQGTLAGLLQFQNTTLPSVVGNGSQQGSLNQLAQSVADQVNTLLTNGQISAGPPPVPGVALFSYTAGAPTSVAQTLAVTNITGSQLAAIDPATGLANGTADALSQLATPNITSGVGAVNGMSYMDDYSSIASGIGNQASNAATAATTQTQLLTQAQTMRSQISGVSLNDQAAQLLQFQQAYEASAQTLSTINQTLSQFMTDMEQAG
jgi:flagellar hook-associated protein 1 FlgK